MLCAVSLPDVRLAGHGDAVELDADGPERLGHVLRRRRRIGIVGERQLGEDERADVLGRDASAPAGVERFPVEPEGVGSYAVCKTR